MKLLIVGVGQTFNLSTKQMEDALQVQTPDGGVISIPTTNEAAQSLVRLAMNEGNEATQRTYSEHHIEGDVPGYVEGLFPESAGIFGGSGGGSEMALDSVSGELDDSKQLFVKTKQSSKKPNKLSGRARNPTDRSGVPSYGLSRVDEKGNPILPPPPDMTMDEEEDPGEQI